MSIFSRSKNGNSGGDEVNYTRSEIVGSLKNLNSGDKIRIKDASDYEDIHFITSEEKGCLNIDSKTETERVIRIESGTVHKVKTNGEMGPGFGIQELEILEKENR